jgi:hypothetical protein
MMTVRERADTIGTLRHASIFAMETLARWVPTTPDLEVKILFGRHIWEFAQHADALGKRTHELRAALHYSPAPLAEYSEALNEWRATEGARERMECTYDVFLPDLAQRYRDYVRATDVFLDEPSIRVVTRILADLDRMIAESHETRRLRLEMTRSGQDSATRLRGMLANATAWVKHRQPAASVAESLA